MSQQTTPTFTITSVTTADSAALAANSRHRTLDYHTPQFALRCPRNLLRNRATARHEKAVDTTTGKVVGYARWSLPEGYPDAWPEAIIRVAERAVWDPDWSSDELLDKVREVEREVLGRGLYMILGYLAVHPDEQRQGIVTALVRNGMRQAEKLGLDIFVHAMKPGVKVYQWLGFRMEREVIQDGSMGGLVFGDYFPVYTQVAQDQHIPNIS
ncbi:hypothetical protein B0T14DRAFT_535825 [Immersiella caudata]|uniref:N-acetyltransferase domain-containing protein n=1 Tax=Immersiella caudata TaxID=314043 RepID=A0AA39WW92_9PEZI|nr:hypothetical protein B0T14DRAFT_535825 [Immersiella caudata]